MKLDKNSIMDMIVYFLLASILVWAYLKTTGYINTPVPVQMWPYVGAIFAFGMFYQRFATLERDVRFNSRKLSVLERDIGFLRSDMEVVKENL